jgi:hypothetical protein
MALLNSVVPDSNYRGVVALNNIGVTLLQRSCNYDAIRTFGDALDLMSCVRDAERHSLVDEKRCAFLKAASKRVARSTKEEGSDLMSCHASGSTFQLSVLCQHENNTFDVLSAVSNLYSGLVYRLELDESKLDIVTDTAIVLHNFSVAIRAKAPRTRRKSRRRAFERAILVSHIADEILSRQLESIEFNHEQQEEILKITMSVFQDLIVLHSIQKEVNLATKYYSKLASVRSRLLRSRDFELNKLQKMYIGAQAA